jgi:ribonuclease HII
MGLVFGMDEAGYGPNLGPLVITVTAWEVPRPPGEMDFWDSLRPIIARTHEEIKARDRLLVGDSKEVYSPARGLRILEESVLTLLSPIHPDVTSFQQLSQILTPESEEPANREPWYAEDLPLPHSAIIDSGLVAQWQATCQDAGIVLRGVASDLVLTERYNNTVRIYNSKGLALSRMSLALLRSLWDPDSDEPTLIIADKHGGRNRYDELLAEVLEDRFIFRLEEGTARSRYRVGKTDLCIQSKAESHFPVAVASMVSKYLRELAMTCFNRFWQSHLPHLKPTKGYPLDARRFREEIVSKQKELGIPDATLWRER